MNQTLYEDFEYLYARDLPWDRLMNKNVLVTGGTGLIGSLLIRFMDYLNCEKDGNIRIHTIVRDVNKAEDILKGVTVNIMAMDIAGQDFPKKVSGYEQKGDMPERIEYIFHCAAVTRSSDMAERPVEVCESILTGTNHLLKLARVKKTESFVYLSSMEAYGQPDSSYENVTEDVVGYINPLTSRSCYSLGKRMAENICFDYFSEYQVPVKIARLAQTFGAGVLPTENRVFAQFAGSVKRGEDIVLHTDGSSVGNYCYTADALFGLFILLFKGKSGEAYNISNEKTNMTIRQMAELVADRIAGGKIQVIYDIPEKNSYGYAPKVKMKLCSDKIKCLGWSAKYDIIDMYERMMK